MPEELLQRIAALHGEGRSVQEIADAVGLSRTNVYYYLHQLDLELPSDMTETAFYEKVSERKLRFLYITKDLSLDEIAAHFGCQSIAPVRRALIHHNIPLRPRGAKKGSALRIAWRSSQLGK